MNKVYYFLFACIFVQKEGDRLFCVAEAKAYLAAGKKLDKIIIFVHKIFVIIVYDCWY